MTHSEIAATLPSQAKIRELSGRALDHIIAQTFEPNPPALDPNEDYLGRQMSSEVDYSPLGFWTVVCEYENGDVPTWKPLMFSTNIEAAWKIVDYLTQREGRVFKLYYYKSTKWACEIGSAKVYGDAAPEAICRTALMDFVK